MNQRQPIWKLWIGYTIITLIATGIFEREHGLCPEPQED